MRVQDGDGFSLAECGRLSLAGLLLGEERIFLPPAMVCEGKFLLLGKEVHFLLLEPAKGSER